MKWKPLIATHIHIPHIHIHIHIYIRTILKCPLKMSE